MWGYTFSTIVITSIFIYIRYTYSHLSAIQVYAKLRHVRTTQLLRPTGGWTNEGNLGGGVRLRPSAFALRPAPVVGRCLTRVRGSTHQRRRRTRHRRRRRQQQKGRRGLTNADERRTGEWTDADGRGQKGRFGPDLALLFPSAKDAAPRRLPRRRSQKRLNGGISGVGLTLLRLREKPRIKRDKAIIIGAPGYPKVSLYDLWNVTMLRACILTKNKGLWI